MLGVYILHVYVKLYLYILVSLAFFKNLKTTLEVEKSFFIGAFYYKMLEKEITYFFIFSKS